MEKLTDKPPGEQEGDVELAKQPVVENNTTLSSNAKRGQVSFHSLISYSMGPDEDASLPAARTASIASTARTASVSSSTSPYIEKFKDSENNGAPATNDWDIEKQIQDWKNNEAPAPDTEAYQSPSKNHAVAYGGGGGGASPSSFRQRLSQNRRIRSIRLWYKKKVQPFWKITIAQILCVIYILVLTFSPPPVGIRDPVTNDIIDTSSEENTTNGVIYVNGSYRAVVAIGAWQKFCLAMSRMSAFSLYPMLVVVFFTKMKGIQTFLSKTPLSMYLGVINQGHDFHAHAGKYIALDVWIHTIFHLLRWLSQGNIKLLWTSAAGISGLITVVATPLITFPMMYYKHKLSYEIRKGLHYLFYLFAVAMCFHVPPSAIPNGGFIAPILSSCIVLYTLDACYVYIFMCEQIGTTAFSVLSSGVRISMPVSERFQKCARNGQGGYAYILIPWINDKQWHPFSLFEDPEDPSTQQMFLMKSGDWTSSVHKALSRDTTRPCWIKGPFPSPYSHASGYDNQILVASGIGITPALGAINAFKDSRRVNLIWAVRDPEMLEFFLKHMYLDHDGWNLIYYTGNQPICADLENTHTNIRIIRGRPKLSSVIPNVVYGIESKEGLPEGYTEMSKAGAKKRLLERMVELDADSSLRAEAKVTQLREYGEVLGFSLHELMNEISRTSWQSFNTHHATTAEKEATQVLKNLRASMEKNSEWYEDGDDPEPTSTESNRRDFLKELVVGHSTGALSAASLENTEQATPKRPHKPPGRRRFTTEGWSMRDLMKGRSSRALSAESPEDTEQAAPKRPCVPPGGRRISMERWTVMRNVVDTRDSNLLLTPAFNPWEEDAAQEMCVKKLNDHVMSTWGIMYCGGSKPVISDLREISIDYNMDLHVDSFAW